PPAGSGMPDRAPAGPRRFGRRNAPSPAPPEPGARTSRPPAGPSPGCGVRPAPPSTDRPWLPTPPTARSGHRLPAELPPRRASRAHVSSLLLARLFSVVAPDEEDEGPRLDRIDRTGRQHLAVPEAVFGRAVHQQLPTVPQLGRR